MTRPRPPRGNAGLDKKDEEDMDMKVTFIQWIMRG